MILKILKVTAISILSLLVLLLLIALFIPREYSVSVSTTIHKSPKEVFDYVKLIKNQEYYSVWVMQDIGALQYTGTDGTVGFVASWNSLKDDVGQGSQTITKIDSQRIDVNLDFVRPFEGHDKASTILKALNDSTTEVTCEFYGNSTYPLNLLSLIGKGIILDAEIQNLANLKKILKTK